MRSKTVCRCCVEYHTRLSSRNLLFFHHPCCWCLNVINISNKNCVSIISDERKDSEEEGRGHGHDGVMPKILIWRVQTGFTVVIRMSYINFLSRLACAYWSVLKNLITKSYSLFQLRIYGFSLFRVLFHPKIEREIRLKSFKTLFFRSCFSGGDTSRKIGMSIGDIRNSFLSTKNIRYNR